MLRAALAVAVLAISLPAFAAVAAVAGTSALGPTAVAAVTGACALRAAAAAATMTAAASRLACALTGTCRMGTAVTAAMADRKTFACRRALGVIFDHADEGMILDHGKLHADDPLDVAQQAALL